MEHKRLNSNDPLQGAGANQEIGDYRGETWVRKHSGPMVC